MKLAILSDIHANIEALRATLDDARGADRILCLGDIVGYNTDPEDCIALLRAHDAIAIAGNHDRAVTGQLATEGWPAVAERAVQWTREYLSDDARNYLATLPSKTVAEGIVMVHGALHPETGSEMVRLDTIEARRLSFAALATHPSGARICAFGHTHQAGIFEQNGEGERALPDGTVLREDRLYLVNPGTVGHPRSADLRATWLMFDTVTRRLTLRRVDYDYAASFAKTRRAGLAPPLSFLPHGLRKSLVSGVRAVGLYDVAKRMVG
jgi:predicted phosphodiesterase